MRWDAISDLKRHIESKYNIQYYPGRICFSFKIFVLFPTSLLLLTNAVPADYDMIIQLLYIRDG